MFCHNFKYSLKVLLKNKALVFWTILFPIIMATLFHLAFKDILNSEKLHIMNIAVVNNDSYINDNYFKNIMESLSNKNDKDRLFNLSIVSENDALDKLNNGKVIGIVDFNDKPSIKVKSDGAYETILRFVINDIYSNKKIINNLTQEEITKGNIDVNKIYQDTINYINSIDIKLNDTTRSNMDYGNIEYYTLIAMSCLYGAMLSMYITNTKLANMNSVGKRTSISPLNKFKTLLGSLMASYVVQIVGLTLLLLYTKLLLNVDYGNNFFLVSLLGLIGSFSGLSLGILIASLFKTNENNKIGILIAIIMLWCFLSGMMGISMKYIIDSNVPLINKLNPCAMITDGLYSLYYYDDLHRYWFNIVSLIVFSTFLIMVSIKSLRRQKYDSI